MYRRKFEIDARLLVYMGMDGFIFVTSTGCHGYELETPLLLQDSPACNRQQMPIHQNIVYPLVLL